MITLTHPPGFWGLERPASTLEPQVALGRGEELGVQESPGCRLMLGFP